MQLLLPCQKACTRLGDNETLLLFSPNSLGISSSDCLRKVCVVHEIHRLTYL